MTSRTATGRPKTPTAISPKADRHLAQQSPGAAGAGDPTAATVLSAKVPSATAPASAADAAGRRIPTRRISFEESLAQLPKFFGGGGDLIASTLAAVLSGLFPDGEDFFVRSVRHYRDQITDPVLKRQVAGFIGQESVHGREHRALNDRLAELGYPTKLVERFTEVALRTRERVMPPIANLAATAALEHFTATLAQVLLENEGVRQMFGDPEARGLFMWHALEESEHKAVAFDVYKMVGGSERLRVWTMNGFRYGFTAGLLAATAAAVLTDRDAYRHGNLIRSWRNFRKSPLAAMSGDIWNRLRDYNRPDFHPDDHDTTELVAHWRAELFGDSGSLTGKLATSAA